MVTVNSETSLNLADLTSKLWAHLVGTVELSSYSELNQVNPAIFSMESASFCAEHLYQNLSMCTKSLDQSRLLGGSYLNQSWCILALFLSSEEPLLRMFVIEKFKILLPNSKNILFDFDVVQVYLTDEESRNRVLCLGCLGTLCSLFGHDQEYAELLDLNMGSILESSLDILLADFQPKDTFYNCAALDALASYLHGSSIIYSKYSSTVLLLLYQKLKQLTEPTLVPESSLVVKKCFELLNTKFRDDLDTKRYMSNLFHESSQSLILNDDDSLRAAAVVFTSKWLPPIQDDGKVKGLAVLLKGLRLLSENTHVETFGMQKSLMSEKTEQETLVSQRRFLVDQLLLLPNTFVSLIPIKDHHSTLVESAIFASGSSRLPFTQQIIFQHHGLTDKHRIVLSLKIAQLPDVPDGCTTVPILLKVGFCQLNSTNSKDSETVVELEQQPKSVPFGFKNMVADHQNSLPVDPNIPTGYIKDCYYSKFDYDQLKKATETKEGLGDLLLEFDSIGTLSWLPLISAEKHYYPGLSSIINPILSKVKTSHLHPLLPHTEFLPNSLFVLDIFHVENYLRIKLTIQVKAIKEELVSDLRVHQQDSIFHKGQTLKMAYLNLKNEWINVMFEVIDFDPIDILPISRTLTHNATPAGYASDGTPYFYPPVNMAPLPVKYGDDGTPYYPAPPEFSKDFAIVKGFKYAGVDFAGLTFYVPPGYRLPQPCGFTLEGIPYYNLQSFLGNSFSLVLPSDLELLLNMIDWQDLDFFTKKFLGQSVASSKGKQTFDINSNDESRPVKESAVQALMRTSLEATKMSSKPIKLSFESKVLEFNSKSVSVTRHLACKFRVNRGDYNTYQLYFAPEPVSVFTCDQTSFDINGEGTCELNITFHPNKVVNPLENSVQGALHVVDSQGIKMASVKLEGKLNPTLVVCENTLDFGWNLPNSTRQKELTVYNKSDSVIQVRLVVGLSNENLSPFKAPENTIRFSPLEKRSLTIEFDGKSIGRYNDVIELHASGGESHSVRCEALVGSPIAYYSEPVADTVRTLAEISRERSVLTRKLFSASHSKTISFTKSEVIVQEYVHDMISGTLNARQNAIDFGIIDKNSSQVFKHLTLFNLSGNNIEVSLDPQCPFLSCDYLLKIPPKSAICIQIDLKLSLEMMKREIRGCIDLLCAGMPRIEIPIYGYWGCPLQILTIDYCFFKPCPPNKSEKIDLRVVNHSQYKVNYQLVFKDLDTSVEEDEIFVNCPEDLFIDCLSTCQFTIEFQPEEAGLYLYETVLYFEHANSTPTQVMNEHNICPLGQLKMVGICLGVPSTGINKTIVDNIRLWVSHPKRLHDRYSGKSSRLSAETFVANVATSDFDSELFEVTYSYQAMTGNQSDNSMMVSPTCSASVINKSHGTMHYTMFSSTGLTVDPREITLEARQSSELEIGYSPFEAVIKPLIVSGFICSVQDDGSFKPVTCQTRIGHEIHLSPEPEISSRTLKIDFGQIDCQTHSDSDFLTQSITLFNTSNTTTFEFTIASQNSKRKWSAFEIGVPSGFIPPSTSLTIPIKFFSDVFGSYETTLDVMVRVDSTHSTADSNQDKQDVLLQYEKLFFLNVKGTSIQNDIIISPTRLEFGTTLADQPVTKVIKVANSRDKQALLHVLSRKPFHVASTIYRIDPGQHFEIPIQFCPKEANNYTGNVTIFYGNRLFQASLLGTCGTVELKCYPTCIDFGLKLPDKISWKPFVLTNTGTLGVKLEQFKSTANFILKYVQCFKTSLNGQLDKLIVSKFLSSLADPIDKSVGSRSGLDTFSDIQLAPFSGKNHWAFLRQNIKSIVEFMHGKPVEGLPVIPSPNYRVKGRPILLNQTKKQAIDEMLHLDPLYSYLFMIGWSGERKLSSADVFVFFDSLSLNQNSISLRLDDIPFAQALEPRKLSLSLKGDMIRTLILTPHGLDFGVCAYLNNNINLFNQSNLAQVIVSVTNPSKFSQCIRLVSISDGFSTDLSKWELNPGQLLAIPVFFTPTQTQTKYVGFAEFEHCGGRERVEMMGVGGSAEVTASPSINYGAVKFGTKNVSQTLLIHNNGLLDCLVDLDISQDFPVFRFQNDIDHLCTVEAKSTLKLQLFCHAFFTLKSPSVVSIKWKRTENEVEYKTIQIPITMKIQTPKFKTSTPMLDFETVYFGQNKKMAFDLINDGDLECSWSMKIANDECFTVNKRNGVLVPGENQRIKLNFKPLRIEPFMSRIVFDTEAGERIVTIHAVIGVPFLKLVDELHFDYGIVDIDDGFTKLFRLKNTCRRELKYNLRITKVDEDYDLGNVSMTSLDNVAASPEANVDATTLTQDATREPEAIANSTIFFSSQYELIIVASETFALEITCKPAIYEQKYKVLIELTSDDGETHNGLMSAIGGRPLPIIIPHSALISKFPQANAQAAPQESLDEQDKSTLSFEKQVLGKYAVRIDEIYSVLSGLPTRGIYSKKDLLFHQFYLHTRNLCAVLAKIIEQLGLESYSGLNLLNAEFNSKTTRSLTVPELFGDCGYGVSNNLLALLTDIQQALNHVFSLNEELRIQFEEFAKDLQGLCNDLQFDQQFQTFSKKSLQLALETSKFNMGALALGSRAVDATQLLNISNQGNLPFKYTISCTSKNPDSSRVLSLELCEGWVKPLDLIPVLVSVHPVVNGYFESNFSIETQKGLLHTFSVYVNISESKLCLSDAVIDFGVAFKGHLHQKQLILTNHGALLEYFSFYPMKFDLESLRCIKLDPINGFLQPGHNIPISVVFSPLLNEKVNLAFQLEYGRGQTMPVTVKATGGCLDLDVRDASNIEQGAIKRIEFLECIIGDGLVYSKQILVRNMGNMNATLSIKCSEPNLHFYDSNMENEIVELAVNGFTLSSSEALPVGTEPLYSKFIVQYKCDQPQQFTAPIQFYFGGDVIGEIEICGSMGFHKLSLNGSRLFVIRMGSFVTKQVEIRNQGDFSANVKFQIEPETLDFYNVDLSALETNVAPNLVEASCVGITVSAVAAGRASCTLTATVTYLSQVSFTEQFVFDANVTDTKLFLEDQSNVNIGRILCGKTVTVKKEIINYSALSMVCRLKLENAFNPMIDSLNHSKEPSQVRLSPWKIEDDFDEPLIIKSDEKRECSFTFTAPDEEIQEFLEAKLVFEQTPFEEGVPLTDDHWEKFATVQFTGGNGLPKVEPNCSGYNFGNLALGKEKAFALSLKNKGLVGCSYKMEFKTDPSFVFDPDSVMQGVLLALDELAVPVLFKSETLGKHECSITISTEIETLTFSFVGRSADFKVPAGYFPEELDLGFVYLDEEASTRLPLPSFTEFDLKFNLKFIVDSKFEFLSNFVHFTPQIEIYEHRFSGGSFTFSIALQTDKLNTSALVVLSSHLDQSISIGSLVFSVDGESDQVNTVPVIVTFDKKAVSFYVQSQSQEWILLENDSTRIALDDCSYAKTSTRKFVAENLNSFPVDLNLQWPNKDAPYFEPVAGESETGISLQPNSKTTLTITSIAQDIDYDDPSVLDVLQIAAALNVGFKHPFFPSTRLGVSLVLKKMPPMLECTEQISFGVHPVGSSATAVIKMKNPIKKRLNWEMLLDQSLNDIFILENHKGTMSSFEDLSIGIEFKPQMATAFDVQATIVTSIGSYKVQLIGSGADYSLDVPSIVNAGVLGQDRPEFRRIHMFNPTDLPLRVVASYDSMYIKSTSDEIEIRPHSAANFEFYCTPPAFGQTAKTSIDLHLKNNPSRILATAQVTLIGGKFDVRTNCEEEAIELEIAKDYSVSKPLEICNDGDTLVEFEIFHPSFTRQGDTGVFETALAKVTFQPFKFQMRSKAKQTITISAIAKKGIANKDEQEPVEFSIGTVNLLDQFVLPIRLMIVSKMIQKSVMTFSKVDNSFEKFIDFHEQDLLLYQTDKDLYKLLLPIVRVEDALASKAFHPLRLQSPLIEDIDISSSLIRPPAVPPRVEGKGRTLDGQKQDVVRPRKYYLTHYKDKQLPQAMNEERMKAFKWFTQYERPQNVVNAPRSKYA